jgi:hypothetical protein
MVWPPPQPPPEARRDGVKGGADGLAATCFSSLATAEGSITPWGLQEPAQGADGATENMKNCF